MAWPTIVKTPSTFTVAPNLRNYERVRASFCWREARRELDGLAGGGLNIAHEAIDRHASGPRRDHLALRWLGKGGETEDYTCDRLQALTNRFGSSLAGLGVAKGDRVYALAGRLPELYVAALGTLGLHHAFHVDIPEADYPKLATLEGCVAHLAALGATAHKETAR